MQAGTGGFLSKPKVRPGGENTWAMVAHEAALRANLRARRAQESLAKAEVHQLNAAAAASQAHAAKLQVEFSTRGTLEHNKQIREMQEYCRSVSDKILENPAGAKSEESRMIRQFCSEIEEKMAGSIEAPHDPDIQLGYDLFMKPQEEYPIPPQNPDGSGFDPRVHRLAAPKQASIPEPLIAAVGLRPQLQHPRCDSRKQR